MFGALMGLSGCSADPQSTAPAVMQTDDSPPLPPTGVFAPAGKIGPNGFLLVWNPSSESDFSGYRIYRRAANSGRGSEYLLMNTNSLLWETRYFFQGDMSAGVWIEITAVDSGGRESRPSQPLLVMYAPTGGSAQQQPDGGSDTNTGRAFGPTGRPDAPGSNGSTPQLGGN